MKHELPPELLIDTIKKTTIKEAARRTGLSKKMKGMWWFEKHSTTKLLMFIGWFLASFQFFFFVVFKK